MAVGLGASAARMTSRRSTPSPAVEQPDEITEDLVKYFSFLGVVDTNYRPQKYADIHDERGNDASEKIEHPDSPGTYLRQKVKHSFKHD